MIPLQFRPGISSHTEAVDPEVVSDVVPQPGRTDHFPLRLQNWSNDGRFWIEALSILPINIIVNLTKDLYRGRFVECLAPGEDLAGVVVCVPEVDLVYEEEGSGVA